MRAGMIGFVASVLLCSSAVVVTAEERPRDQDEQSQGLFATPLPKPGDPSYSSTSNYLRRNYRETREAAESCVRRYLSRMASPTSDAKKLGAEACSACKGEMNAESKASYEFDRLLLQDANRAYDSKLHCELPQVYASETIEVKKREADRTLQPVREAKFREKAAAAAECQKKHVLLFALSTFEPAENISIAAFNKCAGLYRDAVEALVSPSFIYGEGRLKELRIEHLEQLKKATLEKDIAIVVEARARQQVETPDPPAGANLPLPTQAKGSGI